jgi:hypothetical protein
MQQKAPKSKNRILSRLSAADMALLQPDLESVELPTSVCARSGKQAHQSQLFH